MEDTIEVQEVSTESTRSTVKNPLKEDFSHKYGNREVVIPSGKTMSMSTAAAKVVGRHLVTKCIEVLEPSTPGVKKSQLAQDKKLRAHYGEMVFGGTVDEDGNPPFKTEAEEVVEQTRLVEDETNEPVENWSWKTLKAKAEELGIFNKEAKRPAVEKAVKAALESE